MDTKLSGIVMSPTSSSYGVTGIILGVYFMLVNNYKIITHVNLFISIAACVIGFMYLVESPEFLLTHNKKEEFNKSVAFIAKANRTYNKVERLLKEDTLFPNEKQDQNIKKDNDTLSIIDTFKLKSQRKNIVVLSYVCFFITVTSFGIFQALGKTKGNFFASNILSYIAEIVAETSSGFIANSYGRINTIKYTAYLGGISFIALHFVGENYTVLNTVIIFITSFAICGMGNVYYIYQNEIFPMNIKSLLIGYLFLLSRIGG